MSEEQAISNPFICSIPSLGSNNNPSVVKKKRNLPGNPDPDAEVVSLSPKTLMATNRFLCEICGKGFQRDQNLQLHRRGHNLPWKLKQRSNGNKEPRKRVYVCPEKSCVHHHPSRALGDLTGIKKHFCRKHGEKKWKCEKCSKKYAVQSDWKAHSKTCGTKEYKCDCGTPFSRRDSYVTHRAYCVALAEETARLNAASTIANNSNNSMADNFNNYHFLKPTNNNNNPLQFFPSSNFFKPDDQTSHMFFNNINNVTPTIGLPFWMATNPHQINFPHPLLHQQTTTTTNSDVLSVPSLYSNEEQQFMGSSANMSATVLLQKAAQIGVTTSTTDPSLIESFGLKFSTVTDGKGFFSGIYGSIMNSNSNIIPSCCSLENCGDHEGSEIYPPPAKRMRHTVSEESVTGGEGETRDFLGVGMHTICHPSPVNGWI
ncbi:zinc finger protein MAGPIE-like [Benincasa hispida]|uniref:zinc finger protein MAGPIE-like n=1 Tax=Benincasa hispida TaxID=102211 RepID=UPI0019021D50|nr:zinc finger protein MAGPIE-like [Benincasa hispida]